MPTIIRSTTPNKPLRKTYWRAKKTGKVVSRVTMPREFEARRFDAATIDDVLKLVRAVSGDRYAAVTLSDLTEEGELARVVRRKRTHMAPADETPVLWFDLDNPLPEGVDVEAWVRDNILAPLGDADAAAVVVHSQSSMMTFGPPRVHVITVLDRPIDWPTARAVVAGLGGDPSIYNAAHPIFVGPPILGAGVLCPLRHADRVLHLRGHVLRADRVLAVSFAGSTSLLDRTCTTTLRGGGFGTVIDLAEQVRRRNELIDQFASDSRGARDQAKSRAPRRRKRASEVCERLPTMVRGLLSLEQHLMTREEAEAALEVAKLRAATGHAPFGVVSAARVHKEMIDQQDFSDDDGDSEASSLVPVVVHQRRVLIPKKLVKRRPPLTRGAVTRGEWDHVVALADDEMRAKARAYPFHDGIGGSYLRYILPIVKRYVENPRAMVGHRWEELRAVAFAFGRDLISYHRRRDLSRNRYHTHLALRTLSRIFAIPVERLQAFALNATGLIAWMSRVEDDHPAFDRRNYQHYFDAALDARAAGVLMEIIKVRTAPLSRQDKMLQRNMASVQFRWVARLRRVLDARPGTRQRAAYRMMKWAFVNVMLGLVPSIILKAIRDSFYRAQLEDTPESLARYNAERLFQRFRPPDTGAGSRTVIPRLAVAIAGVLA